MGELFGLINLVIDTLKHLSWNGVSMWTIMQMIIWFNIVVWPLAMFFLGRSGGGND
jgi:hypothetical protein